MRADRERQIGVARARRDRLRVEPVGIEPVGVLPELAVAMHDPGRIATIEPRGMRRPQTVSSAAARRIIMIGSGG